MHLRIIFVNNQLDAQFFFIYVYFYSLHVSGSHVPIIRRRVEVGVYSHLNTAEPVSFKLAHQTVIFTERHIPDVLLIQLILLMMPRNM